MVKWTRTGCARLIAIGTCLMGALIGDRAVGAIWISPEEILLLPMSGSAWENVFSDAQNSIDTNLGSPASDGDTTAYAKALVYVRTGQESYRQDVIEAIGSVMGTEGSSVRYLGLGLLGYIVAADLVGLPAALDAEFQAYLAAVRFDDLGEARNLIEQHEQRPNNWGTVCGASRLALALYIGDTPDFERGVDVFIGWLDGGWPHDYSDPCWREDYSPPQGINPVGSEWAGALPDDQRRGGCPPSVPCENYVRSALAGVIAQALIVQRHSPFDSWGYESQAIRRAFQFQVDHGCGWPGDDQWQPWLVNWAYGSSFNTTSPPNHGKSMGYTDWTHGGGGQDGPFCGDGNVDPGEDCSTCPADVPCPSGFVCVAGECVEDGGSFCGDGTVDPGENCSTCPQDAPCPAGMVCEGGTCVDPPKSTGLLVAFLGDQNDGPDADAVLQLMYDEGVDLVVHAGDFDYGDNPDVWRAQIEAVFGSCPPYISVAGNHDDGSGVWPDYQNVIEDWLICNGVNYTGVPGEQYSLQWGPLFVVMVTPDLFSYDHAGFIASQLASNNSIWSVADWHKVMRNMQIGGKSDESGWGVYEAAREGGAIVATAHEHSYERTNLLSSMENQTVVGSNLVLAPGQTFAFVSGIGGSSIRDQERCFPATFPYGCDGVWASIYALQQGADFGALFIEFGYDDEPCLAHGYFKDISGFIADEFFIVSTLGGCGGGGGSFCGDGIVDPGETCASCPADVSCLPGESCVDGVCVPDGECWVSNGAWQNISMPPQNGTVNIEYDAVPAASGIDAVTTLSEGSASTYGDNAVLVRFNSSGFIDARDGSGYSADVTVPYSGGNSYHFQVSADVVTHTYSVWVDGVQLASDFDFRTEQSDVTSLDNWAIYNESGTQQICDWTISGGGCPWDLDSDGSVNSVDFLLLLVNWGQYDIDDFLALLAAWGEC